MSRLPRTFFEKPLPFRALLIDIRRRVASSDGVGGRVIACATSATLGIALTVACFYPGYMSSDSVDQLGQARSGVFNDWHPPLMSFVWRFTDQIIPGPLGMLILNNVLFWSGIALICYRCLEESAAPAIAVLGLLPPVFGQLSTVWKDVAFGASMIFAFALLLHAQLTRSKAAWIFSFLPLFYALGVRHNSAPAVLVLMFYSGWVYARTFRGLGSWRTPFVVGALSFVLLLAGVSLLNRKLVGDRQGHPLQQILFHDLTAISLAEGKVLLPGWVHGNRSAPTLDELRRMYTADGLDPLLWGNPAINFETTGDPTALATLHQAWRAAVYQYSGAYVRHRFRVFKSILGFNHTCHAYQEGIEENSFKIQVRSSKINTTVMQALATLRNTLFFRPWIFVSAIIVMLIASLRLPPKARIPLLMLGISALLYEGAYLVIGPGCDFRLSWYTVLAALVMPLLMVGTPSFANPTTN